MNSMRATQVLIYTRHSAGGPILTLVLITDGAIIPQAG